MRLCEEKHGTITGMFGSLDCMHAPWKNCPKAWQASYVSGNDGKKQTPSLVLEAIADYNMWFWNASFGYAGSLNDLNILNLSPFLESLVDGTFHQLQMQSCTVPFAISGKVFNYLCMMVDRIYPMYSLFVRSIHEPMMDAEILFAKWQEIARKGVERAFGNLQGKFQVACCPWYGRGGLGCNWQPSDAHSLSAIHKCGHNVPKWDSCHKHKLHRACRGPEEPCM
jgi:hypothetical protein